MKTFAYKTTSKQVLGDLHTPVSIFLKTRDVYPQSALLESSDFHAGENSLSYIALCPLARFEINAGVCTSHLPDRSVEHKKLTREYNAIDALNEFLGRFHVEGKYADRCANG